MNGMKGFLLCVVLLCAVLVLGAQAPEWQWAQRAGGTDAERGYGIAVDSAGNQFVIGYFQGTASFGTYTLTTSEFYDIFVAKLDPAGNWLWAVRAGGTSTDEGYGIAVDGSGNAYFTGYITGTATFGPYSLTSSGSRDIFAAKLDPSGNYIWAVRAGGSTGDYGRSIAVDEEGNAYLNGYFTGTASFGSFVLTSSGIDDIYTAKLDPEGNFLWAVKAGGGSSDIGFGIALTDDGNAYITGYFQGTASFGTHTLTSIGQSDIFVAKLDSVGNFLWAVRAGGTGSELGYSIEIDAAGNALLTGSFAGAASFGTYSLNSSGYDIFAAKLDPNGNWLWAVRAGGASNDDSFGIAVDSEGNAYITGYFIGTAGFGPITLTSSGYWDLFIAKLDPSGNFLWAFRAGGPISVWGYSIALDESGNAYLTGEFYDTANFGSNTIASSGASDIFVTKISTLNAVFWADVTMGPEPLTVQFTD